jgi:Tol biopolymer transport system component
MTRRFALATFALLTSACGGGEVERSESLHSITQALTNTVRVSVHTNGTQANGALGSRFAASNNGAFVAFDSVAPNLVDGDTNNSYDIFLRNVAAGTTTRISMGPGGEQSAYASTGPSISADGRYVVFQSSGDNLVTGDTNNKTDVFLYDAVTASLSRVSVGATGTQANGNSFSPNISPNGRYVTFTSDATNLVLGDTNAYDDIFIKDLQTGAVRRIMGSSQPNGASAHSSVTSNGSVVFLSSASNLVSGDTNARMDVFLYDAATYEFSRANVKPWGGQTTPTTSTQSDAPRVSDNGRYVVFSSSAPDVVSGDTNGYDDIFVRDRVAGTTTRVSTSSDGLQATNGSSRTPFISADGAHVIFHSYAWNLAPGGRGVFVKTLATGALTRIDVAWDGSLPSVGADFAAASTDFQNVVFYSPATNIVQGDTNAQADIFFADNPAL